ncbi:oligosaccharide flippase family protein [Ruania halotolerans]|uniref:oligosaccharide flippase family protein n=1 Tax=Ruania halotolerans TaxID=2897773 RepID=UPI001E606C27|nr:polysaccharide biosynthesis C-terminal domain-containing protein [Ruania halotolerans]UFU05721.1 polysaccharide biosynthesis C-terminal domain-containing protein [Ruania halotolerans]
MTSEQVPAASDPDDGESRLLARSGLISFGGAALNALMGFVLTFVIARTFGEYGAGVVLQAIAAFSITVGLAKCGMDSVAVWLMPRLRASDPGGARGALVFLLVVVVLAGALGGLLLAIVAPFVAGPEGEELVSALRLLAWFVAPGAVMTVALAGTRGLGGVLPFVLVGSVAVPVARPVLVAVIGLLGGAASIAVGAWAVPLTFGMIAAVLVLVRQVSALEQPDQPRRWWPTRQRTSAMVRFAVPRTLAVGLEQSVLWLDVVLVGILAGTAAAGVYGGASRLIAAGLIVDTAIRVVVSPRFSHFMFEGNVAQVQSLYRVAAMWLVLLSTPIYITLGVFAPTVLGWLGPGFVAGSDALAVLALGSVITMAAGNIHSVLLMSGHSGWAALNKLVALVLNIIGNLVLVPVIGIIGAALAWALSMMVDALLAAIEVRLLVGVRIEPRSVGYALAVPVLTVGGTAAAVQALLGRDDPIALALTIIVGGGLLVGWCALDRRRLNVDLWRRGRGQGTGA